MVYQARGEQRGTWSRACRSISGCRVGCCVGDSQCGSACRQAMWGCRCWWGTRSEGVTGPGLPFGYGPQHGVPCGCHLMRHRLQAGHVGLEALVGHLAPTDDALRGAAERGAAALEAAVAKVGQENLNQPVDGQARTPAPQQHEGHCICKGL